MGYNVLVNLERDYENLRDEAISDINDLIRDKAECISIDFADTEFSDVESIILNIKENL